MTDTKPVAPRTKLWVRILLGVSLGLNLLVLGLAVGAVMRFGGPDRMGPEPRSMGVMLFRELPREDRHALHQMMRDRYGDRSDQRRADVQDLSAALRADPFDAMALQDLLVRETARRGAWQGAVEQAWLARVSAMSGAERSDYADRLLQAIESGHGPRKNGRPRD